MNENGIFQSRVISSIVIAGGLVVIALIFSSNISAYLLNQAVTDCAKVSTVKWQDKNQSGTAPDTTWFDTCMQRKGY